MLSSEITATLIIDADYLCVYSSKYHYELISSLSTRSGVYEFLHRITAYLSQYLAPARSKLLPDIFVNKRLVYTASEGAYSKPPFNTDPWSGFVVHVNQRVEPTKSYYCCRCGSKSLVGAKDMLSPANTVSLSEMIINSFNKEIAKSPQAALILLGMGKDYDVVLELARKYKARIFILQVNEEHDTNPQDKVLDLRVVLYNSSEKIKIEQIPFQCPDSLADYAIGIKAVPQNVDKAAFSNLLDESNHKPTKIEWGKDKEHDGWFVKLFYVTEEEAKSAKKFVLLSGAMHKNR